MQTSGQSQLHFNNIINKPTTLAGYGITDAVTTTGNQTIAGNKSFTGTTTVITPVNASDASTKAYVDNLVSDLQAQIVQLTNLLYIPQFIDSRDGNVYHELTIGNQVWMAENLKYLPSVVGPGTGSPITTTPYYYVYGYDGTNVTDAKETANYDTYGVLYNWPAAMDGEASSMDNPSGIQGVCPTGWHLPSDAEWTELENYLADNGYNYDGTTGGGSAKIAKSLASTSGWNSYSGTGTVGNTDYLEYRNKSGFTALPGGYRECDGSFFGIGDYGIWWSATEHLADNASDRELRYHGSSVDWELDLKSFGFSVRCLRD